MIKAFSDSMTREEYMDKVKKLLQSKELMFVAKSFVNYETYGVLFTDSEMIASNLALTFLNNNITKEDSKKVYELYKDALFNYINGNNFIKNDFNNYDGKIDFVVADYTIPFTKEVLDTYFNNLFLEKNGKNKIDGNIRHNQVVLSSVFFKMFIVYSKDTLFNNKELVEFELTRGYLDKYYIDIENGHETPDIEQRKAIYEREKDIPVDILYVLKDLDLLITRINSLEDKNKFYYLNQLAFIPLINDSKKIVEIIKNCLIYYEKVYRKEIIDSLYSGDGNYEVTDYSELKPLLLHVIIRDPMERFLPGIERELKKNIIERRKVVSEEELSEKEAKEYNKKRQYILDVLLNPFVTGESVNMKTIHTGKNNRGRWYQSNTSDQLSASLYNPRYLLDMENCIGIGFDRGSLSEDNIVLSANTYITTNKGLANLEILSSKRFRVLSSPLGELSEHKETELILYRDINGKTLKTAYIFAIVTGKNIEEDNKLIEKAEGYAFINGLPFKVFRVDELRKSYESSICKVL